MIVFGMQRYCFRNVAIADIVFCECRDSKDCFGNVEMIVWEYRDDVCRVGVRVR